MEFYITELVNCIITTVLVEDYDISVEDMQVYRHRYVFLAYAKMYGLFCCQELNMEEKLRTRKANVHYSSQTKSFERT